jgi:uncharacterized metal-binding protein
MWVQEAGGGLCIGLAREAHILIEILEQQEFEVILLYCRLGAVHKDELGLKPSQKIGSTNRWESMCNPIAQAEVINIEIVDLRIMLGLCIGHDTFFVQHCRVPLTVLAVKDRWTGHNPLAPLYLSTSYYRSLQQQPP